MSGHCVYMIYVPMLPSINNIFRITKKKCVFSLLDIFVVYQKSVVCLKKNQQKYHKKKPQIHFQQLDQVSWPPTRMGRKRCFWHMPSSLMMELLGAD